jgi:hypothetical protein
VEEDLRITAQSFGACIFVWIFSSFLGTDSYDSCIIVSESAPDWFLKPSMQLLWWFLFVFQVYKDNHFAVLMMNILDRNE